MTLPSAGGSGAGKGEGDGTGAGAAGAAAEWQPGSVGTTAARPGSRVTDTTPGVATSFAACPPVSRAVKPLGAVPMESPSRTV
ncbi:hypothetical protein [Streptomyces regalis]|uniref:hypothetical protein n=1 Tax=Streptomyces regalis TaxID=68262 RepID=UPI00131E4105|nr:hypothetical protein [Streptomyces regalis]